MLAHSAILACVVADPRVDDDVVARRDIANVRPNRVDDSARVASDDPWRRQRHAGQTSDREQIDVVQRSGANANTDVAGRVNLRHRKVVAHLELLEAAVRRDPEGSPAAGSIFPSPDNYT